MKNFLRSTPGTIATVFLTTATIMSVYEFGKELVFEGTLSPWQSHTITIVFTSLMAAISSSFHRLRGIEIARKEKALEVEAQKAVTLRLVLKAVHHIVNNFVNHFQLAQLELEENGKVSEQTAEMLEQGYKETRDQLKILEHLDDPSDESKYNSIFPS